MSIYSKNRSGSMYTSMIRCNETYTGSDLGLILYESECNNQKLFEAILANDFREINGLREGTLLESEVDNKKSIKDLIAKVKEKLAFLWSKIKSAFETVIRKIAAYFLKDGKAFVEDFKIAAKKGKIDLSNVGEVNMRTDFKVNIADVAKSLQPEIIDNNKSSEKIDIAAIVAGKLGSVVGQSSCAPKDFSKVFVEKSFTKRKLSNSDVGVMCKAVEDGKQTVKNLIEARDRAKKAIDDTVAVIKKYEKKSDHKDIAKNVVALGSACESIVTCICRACIKVEKATIKSYRSALGKIKSDIKHENAIWAESAAVVADDEIEDAFDGEPQDMDDETEEKVDELIANADAEVPDECGGMRY